MLDYEVLNVIIGDLIIKTVVECKQSIIRISIILFLIVAVFCPES